MTQQNPWGVPDNGQGQSWNPGTQPQQVPRPSAPYGRQPSGGGAGLAVAVVSVVVAVALLAGVVWWFILRDKGDSSAAGETAPSFTSSAGTAGSSAAARTSSVEPSPQSPAARPTTAAPRVPSASPQPPQSSGSGSWPQGLSYSGWTGYRAASCNADDTWVYAGGNSSTKVVVCRVGAAGDLYYRGMRNNKGYEEDVDMSTADVDSGYFSVPANPSRIVIDGDELTVYGSDGRVAASEDFNGEAWTRD